MFQPFSAVRLGNTAETPAFLCVSSLAKGTANTFWYDPVK